MIPVILVVGTKKSGKTMVMEKLIEELTRRGFRVGALKHSIHHFDFDREDKDTGRFAKAGARAVAGSSPGNIFFYQGIEELWEPEKLRDRFFEDVDIILGEGFKSAPLPRIEVLRKEEDLNLVDKHGLLAIVTDLSIQSDVPLFALKDISGIADFIEKNLETKKEKREVTLYVNGKKVKIKPFIKDFFLNIISAMVASLKGAQKARRITITIDRYEEE